MGDPDRLARTQPIAPAATARVAFAALALPAADLAVGALAPDGVIRDPRFSVVHAIPLLAAEWLTAATAGALLALIWSLSARRATSSLAARLGLRIAVGAMVLVPLASWSLFVTVGAFLDVAALSFVSSNPVQFLKHLLAMNPVLLAASVALGAGSAMAGSPGRPRFAGRLPSWAGTALAVVAASAALAAAGLVAWGEASARHDPRMTEDDLGAPVTIGTFFAEARSDRAGPFAHLVLPGARRETARPIAVSGTAASLTVVRPPLESVGVWADRASESAARHSVIVFVVESLRADVLPSLEGSQEVMPHLDALARTSLRFRSAYTQATHSDYADPCSLSSQYPLRWSAHRSYDGAGALPRVFLYDLLRARGYRTAVISSQNEHWSGMSTFLDPARLDLFFHSESAPEDAWVDHEDRGFARWTEGLGRAGKLDDRVTVDRAIRWIDESPRPFFVYMNLQSSHFPYRRPADFPPRFRPETVDFPFMFGAWPREKTPIVINRYRNALAYIDMQIGRLLDHLRATGRMDETIVVVTGDTGQAFFEHGWAGHGGPPFEEVVRVPLIVHAPGIAGADVLAPVQHVDVAPTVLGLLGLPRFGGFQGRNVLTDGPPPSVYLLTQTPASHQLAIVRDGHKLIHDVTHGRSVLFDLGRDPGERTDLCASEVDRCGDLRARLQAWVDAQLGYYTSRTLRETSFPPVVAE